MVNASLREVVMPSHQKEAMIHHLLKKAFLIFATLDLLVLSPFFSVW